MTIHQVFATVCSLILLTLSGGMIAKSAEINEPIQPLKLRQDLNLEKVNLGRSLFNDKRLSRDNSISCASCHDINKGGVDQLPVSKGVGGALGTINTPTVLNSSLNFGQFWDGSDGTIPLKHEMDSDWPTILTKLQQDQAYADLFKKLYKNGLQSENIKDTISEYERSLITLSRFDRYLLGQKDAIKENEIKGYELFKRYGCVACHQGVNIGGNMYQLFGVMGDYFKDRGNITTADLGHFNVSKDERDRHKFKVPSLRNVALTAPYFHDGSAKTLRDAVRIMAKYQLGRNMPEKDEELIIQFLQSLSGELPVQAKGEQ